MRFRPLVALCAIGCVVSHRSYHIEASRPLPTDVGAAQRVEGSRCTFFFLYTFPFTDDGKAHTVGDAMETLSKQPLVDVTIDNWWRNFGIGSSWCTVVSGRPTLD